MKVNDEKSRSRSRIRLSNQRYGSENPDPNVTDPEHWSWEHVRHKLPSAACFCPTFYLFSVTFGQSTDHLCDLFFFHLTKLCVLFLHLENDSSTPLYHVFCVVRPVFKKGDRCLIHFCQMPDSSDNWGTCWPESEPPEVSPTTILRGIRS